MMKSSTKLFLLLLAVFFTFCNKEEKYVYQLEEVVVQQVGAEKENVKKSTEYIAIAYSDIYGKTIPTALLDDLKEAYVSFGDVTVIEDLIVRNFLNDAAANIPSNTEMRSDVEGFVENCFLQFYGREAGAQEKWFFKKKIDENADLTPEIIYYSFLTSNEYKQF